MSSNETNQETTIQSNNVLEKNGDQSVVKYFIETLLIINDNNLWSNLSQNCQNFGKELISNLSSDISYNSYIINDHLYYSLNEYIKLIKSIFKFNNVDSNFWKIVTKITYLIMSIEKNPHIYNQLQDQSSVEECLTKLFGANYE